MLNVDWTGQTGGQAPGYLSVFFGGLFSLPRALVSACQQLQVGRGQGATVYGGFNKNFITQP